MTQLGKLLDEREWKIKIWPMATMLQTIWLVITITRADGSTVYENAIGPTIEDEHFTAIFDELARIKNGR